MNFAIFAFALHSLSAGQTHLDIDLDGFDGTLCMENACPQATSIEVPTQAQSIQAAVDLVGDRGEIRILPGTYAENIVIAGKRVKLTGVAGSNNVLPTLAAANPAEPVVRFAQGAGGRVSGLTLLGGFAGIAADDSVGLPAGILVKNVRIAQGTHGIHGSFSKLGVTQVDIGFTQGDGLAVVRADRLGARRVQIHDVHGNGVTVGSLAHATFCTEQELRWIHIKNTGKRGIVLANSSCGAQIDRVIIEDAVSVGIDLINVGTVSIRKTRVSRTTKGPAGGGNALRIWSTKVTVDESILNGSEGPAALILGCDPGDLAHLTMLSTGLDCNPIDVVGGSIHLLTGEKCSTGWSLTAGEGADENVCRECGTLAEKACRAETMGFAPIPRPL